jgi:hypothetical protein
MIYDDFAQRLTREYEMYLIGLTGRYLSLMAPGIDTSPWAIGQLQASAEMLRKTFLTIADRTVKDYVNTVSADGMREQTQAFMDRVASMTMQNVQLLTDRMKGAKNNTFDAVKENLHGAMGLLLQRQLTTPEYVVTTASGRSYKAAPLMNSEARQFGYQRWLQAEMEKLSWQGDLAEVRYPDPEHEGNGLIFSMSGATPGYPSFEDIAQTVFHYNSTATIAPHVPAQ